MSIEFFVAAIVTIVGLSTPILLAGLGELVVEKSGVLNLGVEGMMLIGAIAGFAGTVFTGNPYLGVLTAAICGALTIFGTGLSSLLGLSFTGRIVAQFGSPFPAALAKHPIGQLFFGYSP